MEDESGLDVSNDLRLSDSVGLKIAALLAVAKIPVP